jgi:hypothetical protein
VRHACIAVLAAMLAAAWPAAAQEAGSLEEAEHAYADVDFERTRSLAREVLERGGNPHAATARLYLLWGTAAAALEHAEEARAAFRHLVAADPELRLDKNLSPKIRSPYLEARGSLALAQGRLPLEATLQRRGRELELSLRDSLSVAKRVQLAMRTHADEPFTLQGFEARALRLLPPPRGQHLEFFVHVLDAHGNVLVEHGSREAPRRLLPQMSGDAPFVAIKASSPDRTPYYVTAGVLAALSATSGAVAGVMYARREDAAREWNGPGCERPGSTREQQCAEVDQRRQRAEHLTIGLSAAGGALLVGSVVSLLLAPSSTSGKARLTLETTGHSAQLKWRQALQ